MFIVRKLASPALKRLYRYIFRRIIGKFLLHDIGLEHIDVRLKDGYLHLKNLQFDPHVLNSHLSSIQAPVRVLAGTAAAISAQVSYGSILSNSCSVVLDKVHFRLALSKPVPGSKDAPQSSGRGRQQSVSNDSSLAEAVAESGFGEVEKGLEIVGSWLDRIIASAKVRINQLTIVLEIDAKHHVELSIDTIESTDLSEKTEAEEEMAPPSEAPSSQGSHNEALALQRSVRIGPLGVTYHTPVCKHGTSVLQLPDPLIININLRHQSHVSPSAPGVDVVLGIPSLLLQFHPELLGFVDVVKQALEATGKVLVQPIVAPRTEVAGSKPWLHTPKPPVGISKEQEEASLQAVDRMVAEYKRLRSSRPGVGGLFGAVLGAANAWWNAPTAKQESSVLADTTVVSSTLDALPDTDADLLDSTSSETQSLLQASANFRGPVSASYMGSRLFGAHSTAKQQSPAKAKASLQSAMMQSIGPSTSDDSHDPSVSVFQSVQDAFFSVDGSEPSSQKQSEWVVAAPGDSSGGSSEADHLWPKDW